MLAGEVTFAPDDDDSFEEASNKISALATKLIKLQERVLTTVRATAAGPAPLPERPDRSITTPSKETGDRPPDDQPLSKRPKVDTMEEVADARTTARTEAYLAGPSSAPSAGNPFSGDNASFESRHFAPLLIAANLARRKICDAVVQIGGQLVDLPDDQMLIASDAAFASAPLRAGADESASDEARGVATEVILRSFGKLRSAAAELKAATSRAVNIYWLANHTQGANWDTVAQLVHREGVDAYMSAVTDGYTPLASWDERVKTAMKEARQEQHLAKDASALGPLCPELKRKAFYARPNGRDGAGASRHGHRHSHGGRGGRAHGKENRRGGGSGSARHGAHSRDGGNGRGRGAAPGAAAAGQAAAAAEAGGQ